MLTQYAFSSIQTFQVILSLMMTLQATCYLLIIYPHSIGLISELIFIFILVIGEEDGKADDLPLSRLPAALAASKAAAARGYPHGVSYQAYTTAREH